MRLASWTGFLPLALAPALLCGCGASPAELCSATASFSLSVVPYTTPVADHAAAAPANQVQFLAESGALNSNGHCAVPEVEAPVYATWTTSDAMDVQISSAKDNTNGLATCIGSTLTPATLTATYAANGITKTATAQLTCK